MKRGGFKTACDPVSCERRLERHDSALRRGSAAIAVTAFCAPAGGKLLIVDAHRTLVAARFVVRPDDLVTAVLGWIRRHVRRFPSVASTVESGEFPGRNSSSKT